MAKAKILLASSTKFGLELMRGYLKNLDLLILAAEDGLSVLRLVQKERPQLIIMEMDLPVKSGVECCWQLRHAEGTKAIPLVLISTGHSWDTDVCLAAGCSDILTMPLEQSRFATMCHALLKSIDERRDFRAPCRATVYCHGSQGSFYGTIEDISPHGMFVGSPQPLAIGTMVSLKFFLPWPEAEPFSVEASVSWVNRGRNRKRSFLPDGFGVFFRNPSSQLVDHIERFIEHGFLLLNPLD